MNLNQFINDKQEWFNDALIDSLSGFEDPLHQSMCYALSQGGKHIRPFIIFAILEMLNTSIHYGLSAAKAIEYMHTYSLIHDDLPPMDDDDFRRGKPSVHKAYDEATAILAGDALQTMAFEVIASDQLLSFEQRVQLSLSLSVASGHQGMVYGQMLDILNETREISMHDLKYCYSLKTGCLIRFPFEAACIIARPELKLEEQLMAFQEHFGFAFQLHNDLKDILWSDQDRGKIDQSDIEQHKHTVVQLMGLEEAKRVLREQIQHCEDILSQMDHDKPILLAGFLKFLKL